MAIMTRRKPAEIEDDIVAEVRKHREAIAKQVGYDLHALFEHIRNREMSSDAEYVSYPPKRRRPPAKAA
jgi:hypothetical protein